MNAEERKIFLEQRQSGLGGTDAAAIVGENPWKSPMDVYREKVGLAKETAINSRMEWGIRLEPVLVEKFDEIIKDRTDGNITVDVSKTYIQHPEYPFLIAHVDGICSNGQPQAVLECKTAGAYAAKDFGDEWTDEIPKSYLLQCQHYMMVTGLPETYVAVLIGGNDFRVYHVQRNEDLVASLLKLEVDFWNEHVLAQNPPPIDGSEASSETLKEMYPEDSGAEIVAEDEELLGNVERLHEIKDELKMLDADKTECENFIKAAMADASVMTGPNFKISYKKSKDRVVTDWQAVVQEVLTMLDMEDVTKHLVGDVESFIVTHTETKPGSRVFRPTWKE